jgi:hypothetical protein
MLRTMQTAQQGRSGRAGGKEGKRALGERAREDVVEAHAASDRGDHGVAASAFASLGAIAQDRGLHGVGAYFATRAGLAHVALGEATAALEVARAGIGYAETVADKRRIARPFARLHKALSALDADAASALAAEVRERFGLKTLPTLGEGATPNRAQRRALPKACGCCGAASADLTLRFEDDGSVDCPRCGEPLG